MIVSRGTLDEQIVRRLATAPGCTAKALHERIVSEGTACTLRAVYKELGKLEALEIIYRVKTRYSLRLAWVMSLLSFADAAYDTYTDPRYLTELLTSSDGKISHRFTSLRKLDAYWVQMIMALQQLYPKRATCLWCPYQWFYLVHDHTAVRFYRSEEEGHVRRYHIIGSDTYLDRLALQDLPRTGRYSFAQGPFHELRHLYYSIIGEHLITVKLDHAITRRIGTLFAQTTDQHRLDRRAIQEVLSSPVRASLVVEHNERKTKRLRKQFSDYFGEPID